MDGLACFLGLSPQSLFFVYLHFDQLFTTGFDRKVGPFVAFADVDFDLAVGRGPLGRVLYYPNHTKSEKYLVRISFGNLNIVQSMFVNLINE